MWMARQFSTCRFGVAYVSNKMTSDWDTDLFADIQTKGIFIQPIKIILLCVNFVKSFIICDILVKYFCIDQYDEYQIFRVSIAFVLYFIFSYWLVKHLVRIYSGKLNFDVDPIDIHFIWLPHLLLTVSINMPQFENIRKFKIVFWEYVAFWANNSI